MKLALELDGPAPPGGELRGRVVVTEGVGHRLLQVAIRLCEHSRDYREDIVYASAILAREGELAAAETLPFALAVPPQAGPPIHTEWGGLAWEVRAWADVGFKRDPEVCKPLPLG
ncbi:MAG: hypothetical protein MSC31_10125 [Solirubrobacteraceae bacterium MAG38_C4-C5]|nr:hypothetical protein [Candidatus Siliceabacter maunaloa]